MQARGAIEALKRLGVVRLFWRQERQFERPSLDQDMRPAATVGTEDAIHRRRIRIEFQRRRRAGIAEQRHGRTVAFEQLRRRDIAGQDQGTRRAAFDLERLHQAGRGPQPVGIARTAEIDVERQARAQPHARLQRAGGGRNDEVGALRHQDQDIDAVTCPSKLIEQAFRGLLAQVRGQHIGAGDVARAYADRADQAFALGFVRYKVIVVERAHRLRHAGANPAHGNAFENGFGHGVTPLIRYGCPTIRRSKANHL